MRLPRRLKLPGQQERKIRLLASSPVAFLSGVLFSIGLGISGMTQPQKVIGFLDVFGEWDLSLIFVMVGGIISYLILQSAIKRRYSTPVFARMFKIPTRKNIDRNLVLGALLFGVGWGLGGYCPGPAITSLGSGSLDAIVFIFTMSFGMFLSERLIMPKLNPG